MTTTRGLTLFVAAGVLGAALLSIPDPAPAQECVPDPPAADCRSCHQEQHDRWQVRGHAAAGAALQGSAREDPSCLACHAPGGKPDRGVGCTACHGEGFVCGDPAAAVSAGRVLPSERSCRACHRPSPEHPDVEFRFQLDYPAIAHETSGDKELFGTDGI
ncbi:MAG: multiheme c-type cytochrome, partial [Planctomycetota bacterium]